jgi:hypothetical protein
MMASRIYEMALCGEYIAAYSDKTIRFYSRETGRESSLPVISISGVSALTYLPDQRWLLSGSVDGRIVIWDIHSGQSVFTHSYYDSDYSLDITVVAASPDGSSFITVDDVHVCVWSTQPFQEQDRFELSWEPRLGIYLSNEEIILGDLMNDLHLYHIKDKIKEPLPLRLEKGMAYDVVYASQREELYIFTGFNIIRYSLRRNQVLDLFLDIVEEPPPYDHYPTIGILLSQKDTLISADLESNHILILDAITGAIRSMFTVPELRCMMVSPDERILYTLETCIRAWDLATQKELFQILPSS